MFKQNISYEVWGGESGKYRLMNNKGEPVENTPEETCQRIAKTLAEIEPTNKEYWYKEFLSILGTKFAGGGRIMANIGAGEYKKETSPINCTVMRQIPDSLAGIMDVAKEAALTLKSGCGAGYDFSTIRPKFAHVYGAGAATSGIISFMKIFDSLCSTIMSGGGRRGAQMACLDISSPEIKDFIVEKRKDGSLRYFNCSILITDDFMNAVENDKNWNLWFWEKINEEINTSNFEIKEIKKNDIPYNYPEYEYFKFADDHNEVVWKNCTTNTIFKKRIYETVKAKELFDLIMKSTYDFAEPGFILIDRINLENNLYFCEKIRATNPCFEGNTLIAVADGRNAISIKQLAEEGKDVSVYSIDKNGNVSIKIGRNPRITGYNKKLLRIILDDGSYLDTTEDHKFLLLNGEKAEAKNLKIGDSLPRFSKTLEKVKKNGNMYYSINDNILNSTSKIFEHRMIAKFNYPNKWNEIYSKTKNSGFVNTGGLVVHHKDYDSLNNNPKNLEIMTFRDHCKVHAQIDTQGEKNGRYSGITSEEIKNHAMFLTKKLGRRFSTEEWEKYARENKIPTQFSEFRVNELGTVKQLAIICALELGLDNTNEDPRVVKTLKNMIEQGYKAKILNGEVFIEKKCEECKKEFELHFGSREISFCSRKCSSLYLSKDPEISNNRKKIFDELNSKKMEKVRFDQSKIYSDLKFELGREPFQKEWEKACKENKISYRVGKVLKFGFKNYSEVKKAGNDFNHKVSKIIELDGEHTVYNITVDDNHTVGIITSEKDGKINNGSGKLVGKIYSGIFAFNCGEQPLGPFNSCLLGSMILPKYVKNEFEDNALFDFDQLYSDVIITSRLLDNVVELNNLPLDELKNELETKRRHGLGFTGLGSALNMLRISYGSSQSIDFAEKISYILAKASLEANILLAKEKGCAKIFSSNDSRKKVIESNYLKRLINSIDNKEVVINDILKYGLRYSHATSVAPTGTLSLTWGNNCSNGIEPVFSNSYLRNIRKPGKKTKTQEEVCDYAYFLWKEKYKNARLPSYWRTTNDLNVDDHINIQSVVQKWCDSSISKTINIPFDYSFEDFKNVYFKGWKMGLKGLTTFRFNPDIFSGVLVQKENLEKTEYTFVLEDGSEVLLKGSDSVEYDGEIHNVANLFDALKEGIYGNM